MVIVLGLWGVSVQTGNNDLSNLQKVCYERILNTEDILSESIIEKFSVDTVYAPEIYYPSLMIGIRDDYWDTYVDYKKLPLEVDKYYKGQSWYLSYNNQGKVFGFSKISECSDDENNTNVYGNNIIILSKEKLSGKKVFFRTRNDAEKFVEVQVTGEDNITDFWVYTYSFDEEVCLDNIFLVE